MVSLAIVEQTRRCKTAPAEQAEAAVSYHQPGYGFRDLIEPCIQIDLEQVHVSGPQCQIAPERAGVSKRRILLAERLYVDLGGDGNRQSCSEHNEQPEAAEAQS